ncbi:pilus assembly protein PilZ [Legionella israelensis]|uniref:pilus assembly PilX family protein n=1 Tax=Legionella israelensis TaxID=454 RepID=UPI00117E28FD|nr:PilX N-terminal domain-containing pilus assembly protein [Legionella israelensis]QDP72585.1 pilus assembly protein PilZ [Legionella israelensis]
MNTQKGATLAVSLLLLLVITLLGVSAMQVTHMEEKMSSNLQDKLLSFSSAESALRAGEQWVLNQPTEPKVHATCPSHPCVQERKYNIDFTQQNTSWWTAHSAVYPASLSDIATPPRYFIEFMQFIPDTPVIGNSSVKSTGVFYYQITARGTGATNDSISILQTTVARRY